MPQQHLKNKRKIGVKDISKHPGESLIEIDPRDLVPLPPPYDKPENDPLISPLTEKQQLDYECLLDGVVGLGLPKPKSKEEEERLVQGFLSGLKKLLSKKDNWTFLQPLMLSLDYCAKCQNCSEECPVYLMSGKQEIYRPTYRAEVLRRIINKYVKNKGFWSKLSDGDIELNYETVARLAELAYRCTICRRCAQSCVRGVDNALITHELRKLFSQEMGIAPQELHSKGSVQQLKVGASTGLSPKAFKGIVAFMEEEIEEKTGSKMKIPVDKEGADILLIHNSGEYMAWLENPEAFAIIFEAAGLNWTLSSELQGYEGTNYGVWYDDVQFARIAVRQAEVARKLGVKKIVMGECGHAHKALAVIADRILLGEANVPRESSLTLIADLIDNGKLKLDPSRNNFPVTLHDPCNIVRLMGIVEPQRRILKKICPQFREMTPYGVDNFCCGGGSGFAIMKSMNFPDWRINISGRMKFKQILDAFQDIISPDIKKYVCAPCSNCKGQIRDLYEFYNAREKAGLYYGGLVELIVNAMADVKEPFITWE